MTTTKSKPVEIERDDWLRPMVVPPHGDKAIPYTRCTTFVSGIEDNYKLGLWMQRMVALGITDRDDLRLAVAAHRDDDRKLDRIVEDAKEAARSHAAATTGTALHAFTEQLDRGLEPVVPAEYLADIAAYKVATEPLTAVTIEQFSVLDKYKIGGTPDRVVKYKNKLYIADLKTGKLQYGYLKIAAQLAVYARSAQYDAATGERSPHGADVTRGIVIHLPAGSGTCTLYWIDLLQGWEAVKVCRDIREKRALSYKSVVSPFKDSDEPPEPDPELDLPGVPRIPLSLPEQIQACADAETVRALWALHTAEWTSELTTLAKAHIAALGQ